MAIPDTSLDRLLIRILYHYFIWIMYQVGSVAYRSLACYSNCSLTISTLKLKSYISSQFNLSLLKILICPEEFNSICRLKHGQVQNLVWIRYGRLLFKFNKRGTSIYLIRNTKTNKQIIMRTSESYRRLFTVQIKIVVATVAN